MANKERVDDVVIPSRTTTTAAGIWPNRLVCPINGKIVKSYWINDGSSNWSDALVVKITGPKGDLADTMSAPSSVVGQVFSVDHRDEANNSFARGDQIIFESTDGATGACTVVLVIRPL